MGPWRKIVGVGFPSKKCAQPHPHNASCECESCGTGYLLLLSDYEARRLLANMETPHDQGGPRPDGDWHGQIVYKLKAALG